MNQFREMPLFSKIVFAYLILDLARNAFRFATSATGVTWVTLVSIAITSVILVAIWMGKDSPKIVIRTAWACIFFLVGMRLFLGAMTGNSTLLIMSIIAGLVGLGLHKRLEAVTDNTT
jgi:hypothetical protein